MSAISLPAPVELEVPVRSRPVVVGLPGHVLQPPLAAPSRNRGRARTANMFATVLLNGMILSACGLVTYLVSGFVGNVELEAASRTAQSSVMRANAANLAEGGLRRSVDVLQQDDSVERWATFNGFKPPYRLAVAPPTKKD